MKFVLPRGLKSLSDKMNKFSAKSWAQDFLYESEFPVIKKLQDALGLADKKVDIIHHTIRDYIPEHSDNMSKTCYIVPVSITGEWVFYCDGRKDRNVKVGDAIRFNDFNRHGLRMVKEGTIKLFTVNVSPY
jgi:hypothetical protein